MEREACKAWLVGGRAAETAVRRAVQAREEREALGSVEDIRKMQAKHRAKVQMALERIQREQSEVLGTEEAGEEEDTCPRWEEAEQEEEEQEEFDEPKRKDDDSGDDEAAKGEKEESTEPMRDEAAEKCAGRRVEEIICLSNKMVIEVVEEEREDGEKNEEGEEDGGLVVEEVAKQHAEEVEGEQQGSGDVEGTSAWEEEGNEEEEEEGKEGDKEEDKEEEDKEEEDKEEEDKEDEDKEEEDKEEDSEEDGKNEKPEGVEVERKEGLELLNEHKNIGLTIAAQKTQAAERNNAESTNCMMEDAEYREEGKEPSGKTTVVGRNQESTKRDVTATRGGCGRMCVLVENGECTEEKEGAGGLKDGEEPPVMNAAIRAAFVQHVKRPLDKLTRRIEAVE
eukprot:GHVS01096787.1.p1 GENE.GHVS01096787.1~~GHVS01096787.1.p1  ORF type:complete len:395 (+),score=166.34 GHVS01096787.1:892-2076(+)